jgi:hypothetical protein
MDLDLDNTNTGFGSPFSGSPDRSGITDFNNSGTAPVFGNYSSSSNTASDFQFNSPTRNNFSPFMTNTPFIDGPTGNNFSPFMTNTPFIDAPMDCMEDTTNPTIGSPFDIPPNHTLNNNNSPTNPSAHGATAYKGNSGTGFANHSSISPGVRSAFVGSPNLSQFTNSAKVYNAAPGNYTQPVKPSLGHISAFSGESSRSGNNKSPDKPPPKITPTASSDTTSGHQSTFGGPSKRMVNNDGVAFPSILDFAKKKSVTHKLNDPPRRLPSFLNDDSDDSAPFNNSQRKKTSTKADRAARFGSTNKTATYDEVR